jgi:hypothetical protein
MKITKDYFTDKRTVQGQYVHQNYNTLTTCIKIKNLAVTLQ